MKNEKTDIHIGKTFYAAVMSVYSQPATKKLIKVAVSSVGRRYFKVSPSPYSGVKFLVSDLSAVHSDLNNTSIKLYETKDDYLNSEELDMRWKQVCRYFNHSNYVYKPTLPLDELLKISDIIEKYPQNK